ncbi:hypothetical protein FHS31_000832 [Sphingomonas vulcanisoli]|uniref:Head decoration protein n=1 Tax=Sphingomonas vulcanisoli TaxID=1658060 RepID=A0ABX0TP90_9SPHN|nr:hypothetical protein [Sphingomonas vulcanisoli]NIJ07236.1 hypothetical protein [Sphingomonas vulcanisoli]
MAIFGEGDTTVESSLPLYTPQQGAAFALADAVFDPAYLHTTIDGDGEPATTRRPVLGVRQTLFGDRLPAQSDMVAIRSGPDAGRYIVKDVQPDGHGHILLILMGPL